MAAMVRPVSGGRFGMFLTPMDSIGSFRPFAVGSASNHSPSISADGRLLAWVSDESGTNQVFVQPMAGGARVSVSINGGVRAGLVAFGRHRVLPHTDQHMVR